MSLTPRVIGALALAATFACKHTFMQEKPLPPPPAPSLLAWLGANPAPSAAFADLPTSCQRELTTWVEQSLDEALKGFRLGGLAISSACEAAAAGAGLYDVHVRDCPANDFAACDLRFAQTRAGLVDALTSDSNEPWSSAALANKFFFAYERASASASDLGTAIALSTARQVIDTVIERHPGDQTAVTASLLVLAQISAMSTDDDNASSVIATVAHQNARDRIDSLLKTPTSLSDDEFYLAALIVARDRDLPALDETIYQWLTIHPGSDRAHYWSTLVKTKRRDLFRASKKGSPFVDAALPDVIDPNALTHLEALD